MQKLTENPSILRILPWHHYGVDVDVDNGGLFVINHRTKKILTVAIIMGTMSNMVPVHAARATYSPQHVVVRKYPYPFDAILAIDSDADHSDLRKFNEVHKFLDTFAETPMGKGLGLDIADSFFLHNGSNLNAEIEGIIRSHRTILRICCTKKA